MYTHIVIVDNVVESHFPLLDIRVCWASMTSDICHTNEGEIRLLSTAS